MFDWQLVGHSLSYSFFACVSGVCTVHTDRRKTEDVANAFVVQYDDARLLVLHFSFCTMPGLTKLSMSAINVKLSKLRLALQQSTTRFGTTRVTTTFHRRWVSRNKRVDRCRTCNALVSASGGVVAIACTVSGKATDFLLCNDCAFVSRSVDDVQHVLVEHLTKTYSVKEKSTITHTVGVDEKEVVAVAVAATSTPHKASLAVAGANSHQARVGVSTKKTHFTTVVPSTTSYSSSHSSSSWDSDAARLERARALERRGAYTTMSTSWSPSTRRTSSRYSSSRRSYTSSQVEYA